MWCTGYRKHQHYTSEWIDNKPEILFAVWTARIHVLLTGFPIKSQSYKLSYFI